MSTEPIFTAEPVPPRSGMSGATKLILGFGAGCFTVMALACGGLAFFGWKYAKDIFNEDPAVVKQETAKIVQIDVPAGLEPKFSMAMPVPFANQLFSMVIYVDKSDRSLLTLIQVSGGEANEEELKKQLQTQWEAQMNAKNSRAREVEIDPASTREHPAEIHGQTATFTISTGKDKQGREVRVAEGTFKGAAGPAMLYFLGDAETYDEQALEEMLDSMK